MRTIEQIIHEAGGVANIARQSNATRRPVKKRAVYRWRHEGIDEVHWPLMMRLVPDLTVQQIYDANREVEHRNSKRPDLYGAPRPRPKRRPIPNIAA